jgi:8-hydroxy-5-deazaflavin:NADPH oxidoreductase
MSTDGTRPVLGVIGFGKLGTVVARIGLAAGYTVRAAGSGEGQLVEFIAEVVAPGVEAGVAGEVAAGSDLVVLALPLHKYRELPAVELAGARCRRDEPLGRRRWTSEIGLSAGIRG